MSDDRSTKWQGLKIYLICFLVPMIAAGFYMAARYPDVTEELGMQMALFPVRLLVCLLHPLLLLIYLFACIPISVLAMPLGLCFFQDRNKLKIFFLLLAVLCPAAVACGYLGAELFPAIFILAGVAVFTAVCVACSRFAEI